MRRAAFHHDEAWLRQALRERDRGARRDIRRAVRRGGTVEAPRDALLVAEMAARRKRASHVVVAAVPGITLASSVAARLVAHLDGGPVAALYAAATDVYTWTPAAVVGALAPLAWLPLYRRWDRAREASLDLIATLPPEKQRMLTAS